MPRSVKEILEQAETLAAKFENFETDTTENDSAEALANLHRAALRRAEAEAEVRRLSDEHETATSPGTLSAVGSAPLVRQPASVMASRLTTDSGAGRLQLPSDGLKGFLEPIDIPALRSTAAGLPNPLTDHEPLPVGFRNQGRLARARWTRAGITYRYSSKELTSRRSSSASGIETGASVLGCAPALPSTRM